MALLFIEYGTMFNKKLKQELAELREELATNRQIKESLYREMMVMEVDPQGRIQYANPIFLNEMGYRLEDLLGRSRGVSILAAHSACCRPTAPKPGCARSGSRSKRQTARFANSRCAPAT